MPVEITIFIIVLCILLMIFLVSALYDGSRFVIKEYTVESKKIFKNKKIVLLSDLHNKQYGKENSSLLQAIERIAPDMILIAGDMLTANEERTTYEVPVKLIRSLAQKYPIYYANGNHEYRMKVYTQGYGDLYEKYRQEIKGCGVCLLENERVFLPDANIEICGLEIERYYYKRLYQRPMPNDYLDHLLGQARDDCFEILIAHNPDYFKEYAGWGADLTLAGHVHGGVMRLPFIGGLISPMMRPFPKYDGGLFEEYGKKMILGRGLGMHTIPIRIFNPGELVVIYLNAER